MRSPHMLVLLGAGFSVWAAGFVAVYAVLSLGCEREWHALSIGPLSLQRTILLGLGLTTVAAAAWVAWQLADRRRREGDMSGAAAFVLTVAYHAALAATVATAFTFSGLTLLPPCG